MRAVLQRARSASVTVDGKVVGSFEGEGLVILLGVTVDDTEAEAVQVARKVAGLRMLDPLAWPRIHESLESSMADHATLGCCCSFGEWQKSVSAIAVGFRPGGGLPPMAINCGAPTVISEPQFLLDEVRPRLVEMVRRLDGVMGA